MKSLFNIDLNNKIPLIAEIGVNHEGSLDKAKELIRLAKEAGADAVKIQCFSPEKYVSRSDKQRFDTVSKFALSKKSYEKLLSLSEEIKIEFFATPLTEDWVDIVSETCSVIKIASGDITFKPTLDASIRTDKKIILSTGLSDIDDVDYALSIFTSNIDYDELKERVMLMHCVSAYPTPIEEANIRSIPFMEEKYKLDVGYSNHVIGQNACVTAAALGAKAIEVHFTDKKEGREFRDHSLSFEKDDLISLRLMLDDIKKSLGSYEKQRMSCELPNLNLIRKGIVSSTSITKGTVLTIDNLMFARPATNYSSSDIEEIINKKINIDLGPGEIIKKEYIDV